MTVYNYCKTCRVSFPIEHKSCTKCGQKLPATNREYRIEIMVKGRRVTKSIPNSLTKARQVEAQVKADLVAGIYYDKRRVEPTLNEIWTKYLESYKARGKAWKAEERRYNQYLKPKFGNKTLNAITPSDIESLTITLKNSETKYGRPYTPKTIKNIIDLLSIIFNYAIDMDLFEGRNPCNKVKRPRINNEVTNVLGIEQLKKFIAFLNEYEDQPTANLLKLLLFTGIRLGEAFKLTHADINLTKKTMTLRDPKGGKDQLLFINDLAVTVLQCQKKYKHESSDHVFPNKNGQIKTEIGDRWPSIKRAVGITPKFRCHDLRHQFATLLASSGKVDPYTVQRLLTHKDFRPTQRYAHHYEQAMRDGVKVIEEMLAN